MIMNIQNSNISQIFCLIITQDMSQTTTPANTDECLLNFCLNITTCCLSSTFTNIIPEGWLAVWGPGPGLPSLWEVSIIWLW